MRKIGRAFTHGKKSAPSDFAEIEREVNGLSDALRLVAETPHSYGSILSQADNNAKSAISAIVESAHKTLDDLDSFVERYKVIRKYETKGGFVVERSWSDVVLANYKTLKWTTEGGDMTELRNMLHMQTNWSNSIKLTMQTLQSRSLAGLEKSQKTVVPVPLLRGISEITLTCGHWSENIASIRDRVQGDLGHKIDDLHRITISTANSTPSLQATDRAVESGKIRDSTSTVSTIEQITTSFGEQRLLESPPPRAPEYQTTPRDVRRSPRGSPASLAVDGPNGKQSSRQDSAYYYCVSSERQTSDEDKRMDWDFETGSPVGTRSSIGGHIDDSSGLSPNDSAYASSSRRASSRRESPILPNLFRAVDEQYDAVAGSSRDVVNAEVSPCRKQRSWRPSTDTGLLGPPAISDKSDKRQQAPATPSSMFSKVSRTKSNVIDERTHTSTSKTASQKLQSGHVPSPSYNGGNKFEKQLFRNAAILCDVRGSKVEYARVNRDEPDTRYNIDMVDACKEARICVIRQRENRELGGTRITTSIWCLSDDGEVRLQHKLSDLQETVPYCSYFEPEKVSLQSAEGPIELKWHEEQWGDILKEGIRTNWVNYYFASENDAVAFQSAVFGRLLIGSFRTIKTTVIHEGLKGAFAFEEQFANIEMLRLWEDDGVASTAGAAGGVLALMHISSSFGEGWARWWINSSKQQVKIKNDGMRHAKVKGIDITVVRPGAAAAAERLKSPSAASEIVRRNSVKNSPVKQVNGIRIEFKTEEERAKFVSTAKMAQQHRIPLPDM